MILLDNKVKDGHLHLRTPEGKTCTVNIQDVINRNDIKIARFVLYFYKVKKYNWLRRLHSDFFN